MFGSNQVLLWSISACLLCFSPQNIHAFSVLIIYKIYTIFAVEVSVYYYYILRVNSVSFIKLLNVISIYTIIVLLLITTLFVYVTGIPALYYG